MRLSSKTVLVGCIIFSLAIALFIFLPSKTRRGYSYSMIPTVKTGADVAQLFFKTPEDMQQRVDSILAQAEKQIEAIIKVPNQDRTFANTARPFDEVSAALSTTANLIQTVILVYPAAMQEPAQSTYLRVVNFVTDHLTKNRALYQAFAAYVEGNAKNELLTKEEQRFLQETMRAFKHEGLHLPDKKLEEARLLQKKIDSLSLQFEANIVKKTPTLFCTKEELAGLDEAFIASLKRNEKGLCVLPLDMSTNAMVMAQCAVAYTREQCWLAWNNRAYPENEAVLQELMITRDALAKLIGFPSFAHLSLDGLMVENPENAEDFLINMANRANQKYLDEMALFKKHLPAGVTLAKEGKFFPWDYNYAVDQYKKKFLALDNEKIAQHFPVEQTIDRVFGIFSEFLGIEFRREKLPWQWHKDVQYFTVYTKKGDLVGHLILDLFPRPQKFSHACLEPILSALATTSGERRYPIVLIVANFPQAHGAVPALLKFNNVCDFCHECGHAVHELLSKTELLGLSGLHVKHDFVEAPSQTFEKWANNPQVLKRISGHYQTGEPLDDATCATLQNLPKFSGGYFIRQQVGRARYSLACFGTTKDKTPENLKSILTSMLADTIVDDERIHFYCSFGHLTGYGASYYSYLWAEMYAADFFTTIQSQGIFDPKVGERFIKTVLSRGNSADPQELTREFLGRDVSPEAAYKLFGLSK